MVANIRRIGYDGFKISRRGIEDKVPKFYKSKVAFGQTVLFCLTEHARVYLCTEHLGYPPKLSSDTLSCSEESTSTDSGIENAVSAT